MNIETPRLGNFVNSVGRQSTLEFIHTEDLIARDGWIYQKINRGPEGPVYRVDASVTQGLRSRTRHFVLKDVGWPEGKGISPSPARYMQIWKDLKAAGVNVPPTLRIDEEQGYILQTDLTNNGQNELLDLIKFDWLTYISRKSGNPPKLPDWVFEHKQDIAEQLMDNSIKAGKAGWAINDNWFFVFNPKENKVETVLADFGKGDFQEAEGNNHTFGHEDGAAYFSWLCITNALVDYSLYTREEQREMTKKHFPWGVTDFQI